MYRFRVTGSDPETRCADCGLPARVWLGGVLLCDRCFNRRASELMGLPDLPDPPGAEVIVGPDGRPHRFGYRLWRAPSGIVAEAEEMDLDEGYQAKVFGSHEVDVDALVARLRQRVRERVGRLDLADGPRGRPILAGDEVVGRLVWNEDEGPYDVVVDGRRLSWDDLGRALEAFEGWQFRIVIEDSEVVEDRSGIDATRPRSGPLRLH
jgi:hypothetical protein